MSLRTGAPWSRTRTSPGSQGYGFESAADWAEPERPKRDYKKLFLIVGLAGLSWVATYVGMLELIESNMGVLPLVHKLIIGFSVAMLMTMVVWLLDQMFSPIVRVCVPDRHLGRIRLRVLLEGPGEPVGSRAFGRECRRPGAIVAARRGNAARTAARNAGSTRGAIDREGGRRT